MSSENNTCHYCGKSFKRINTLAVHMCPKKKRHMQKDDPDVRIGYRAYQLFYKIGTNSKKPKTYTDFADSQYYAAFIRFGLYCIELSIDDPGAYVEWLLKNGVSLDKWTSDRQFNAWIKDRLKLESADRAVERTIIFLQKWAEETNSEWSTYFESTNVNRVVFHICSGKISPWVLYSSDKAQALLDSLNEEQIKMVIDYIDPTFWHRKMQTRRDDFVWVEQIMESAGL